MTDSSHLPPPLSSPEPPEEPLAPESGTAPAGESAAEPVPPPGPDPFAIVADAVDGMRDELAALGDQFRRRLLNDREARRALDTLQTELGHTRKSAEGRLLQPVLYDLVLLLDRAERQADQQGGTFTDTVTAELLAVLEKYGMTRIPVMKGPFDPGKQEVVDTVAAPVPEADGHVAEVVRHGYRMDERIVRPQQVRVYTAQ